MKQSDINKKNLAQKIARKYIKRAREKINKLVRKQK